MQTVNTTVVVPADRTVTLRLPAEVTPGNKRLVLLVMDDGPDTPKLPFGLIPIDTGPWPEGFTASREQLYDDDGR